MSVNPLYDYGFGLTNKQPKPRVTDTRPRGVCRKCAYPVYHDESYQLDGHGMIHIRCLRVVTPRPKAMGEAP